jgi:hypothetical protein
MLRVSAALRKKIETLGLIVSLSAANSCFFIAGINASRVIMPRMIAPAGETSYT